MEVFTVTGVYVIPMLMFFGVLTYTAIYDEFNHVIKNKVIGLLFFFGFLCRIAAYMNLDAGNSNIIKGAFLPYIIGFIATAIPAFILFLTNAFGAGDCKLLIAIGAAFGIKFAISSFVFATLSMLITSCIFYPKQTKKMFRSLFLTFKFNVVYKLRNKYDEVFEIEKSKFRKPFAIDILIGTLVLTFFLEWGIVLL